MLQRKSGLRNGIWEMDGGREQDLGGGIMLLFGLEGGFCWFWDGCRFFLWSCSHAVVKVFYLLHILIA
jgi:hypothetical protein